MATVRLIGLLLAFGYYSAHAFTAVRVSARRTRELRASFDLERAEASARPTMEECIVDAENDAERTACLEPAHEPFVYAGAPPTSRPTRDIDVSEVVKDIEECLVEAESFLEQQDCHSAITPEPDGPAPIGGWWLRHFRKAAREDFPTPWLIATVCATAAARRVLLR